MRNDEWDALVRRREAQAKDDPRGYRLRVRAWAIGGYSVLLGALALSVGGLVGIAVAVLAGASVLLVKLAIPVGVLAFVVARSLFVRIPPPGGIELTASEAPALFETIERLRRELDAPALHKVLLDGDFNASVIQIPRLGALGWERNYLILGLPFMQALSLAEFSSVLAHELGHISRSHGRFGAWVYRLRSSWAKVMEELDGHRHVGAGAFRRFFRWYLPRFSASSVALVRAHEYEADHAAAQAVGAKPAALALLRATLSGSAEARYWDALYGRVVDEPTPPRSAYTALAQTLPTTPDEDATAALRRALGRPTEPADTHPSLADRLAAFGYLPDTLLGDDLVPPDTTAADSLFGDGHTRLAERLSEDWRQLVGPAWTERHAEAGEAVARLEALKERAAEGSHDLESARERARLTEDLHGADAAFSCWRDVLALDPTDPAANLSVGQCLLAREDDEGLEHLERAGSASPSAAIYASEVAYAYVSARGRADEAAGYRSRMNAGLDVLDGAADERRTLTKRDALEPHSLPPEALAAVAHALAKVDRVGAGYVARKQLEHMADEAPLFVVGVAPAVARWRYEGGGQTEAMIEKVASEIDLPGQFLVVPLTSENRWLKKRLKGVAGARVFAR
jgi:Zn-dependent protease with chaperone function